MKLRLRRDLLYPKPEHRDGWGLWDLYTELEGRRYSSLKQVWEWVVNAVTEGKEP